MMLFPIAIQLGVLLLSVLATLRQRHALKRMIREAQTPENALQATSKLPPDERAVFEQLLQPKQSFEEALQSALITATEKPFYRPIGWLVFLRLLLILTAWAPAANGLYQLAITLFQLPKAPVAPLDFAKITQQLEHGFAMMRDGAQASAWLMGGTAVILMFVWWLDRAEVREARTVQALLTVASQLWPGQVAPESSTLSRLLSPKTNLRGAILASGFWLAAVSFSLGLLAAVGPVRKANLRPLSLDVWPREQPRPYLPKAGIELPQCVGGGQPLNPAGQVSLNITPSEVVIQNIQVASLENGLLLPGWQKTIETLDERLKDYERPLRMLVSADQQTPAITLAAILNALSRRYKVAVFQLIAEREQILESGESRVMQVGFDLFLKRNHRAAPLKLRITPGVTLLNGQPVALRQPEWLARLQAHPKLLSQPRDELIRVELTPDLRFQDLIEALSHADSMCVSQNDCGLPGLGLGFYLARVH